MIKFGLEDFTTEMPNWAKHHKQISLFYMQETEEGESKTEDERLLKLIEKYPERLTHKAIRYLPDGQNTLKSGTNHYLILDNLDYETGDIDYYSVGASNTEQETYIRIKFVLENTQFFLDYKENSSGHFASNFYNFIDYLDIKDIIEEKLEDQDSILKHGIEKGEDSDYNIVVLDSCKYPTDIQIEFDELLNGLVGIEVYKFEQVIK